MKRWAHSTTWIVLATCLLFYAINAIGEWVMRYVGNVEYGSADMLPWVFPMEVVALLLLAYVTRRFFVLDEVGLGAVRGKKRWLDLGLTITPIVLAGLFLVSWLAQLSPQGLAKIDKGLLVIGTLVFGMVGISEEWMFRGLVFHHFAGMKTWRAALSRVFQRWIERGLARQDWSSAISVAIAILVNALLFSLLHATNLIGGYPPAAVAYQLIGTFAFGILFGVLAWRLPSIRPLMAWHFFWDFTMIVGAYVHTFK